ncbi:MAG: DUF533 domain-containing protein [Paracoccaceae bacterium]
MSLMKTLTKVAIGIAVAKGVQHVTTRANAGTTGSTGTSRAGTPSRRPGTGSTYAPDESGMGGIMDEILGAGKTTRRTTTTTTRQTAPSGGGLEDLLGSLTGSGTSRSRTSAPKGGLEDLLSGKAGSGGIGDLLGAVLGGGALGGALGGLTGGMAQAEPEPDPQDEAQAAVLLRAMIMAAKADGKLDADEKANLMQAVGDASRAEIDFINRELATPVDIDGLLNDVPRGMEEKVYMASVMAINLDDRSEAQYLHELAQALGLTQQEVNALHDHMKAPRIYS